MAKKSPAKKATTKKKTPANPNSVSEIYVMIGDMGHSIKVWRWPGLKKQYNFIWDSILRRHIVKFDSIESYEAAREDIVHNTGGRMLGSQGFQVLIVTPEMKKELDQKRKRREERLQEARAAQIQAGAEANKAVKKASNALDEARKKIGATSDGHARGKELQLKATSLTKR